MPEPRHTTKEDPMRTSIRTLAVAVVLVAGLAAPAWAQGPGGRGKGARMGKAMGPMAALNLSAEQKQKIDQLHETAAKQAEPIQKEMAAKAQEMQALWAVEKPDRAAIERKHGEMAALQSKLWGIHIDTRLQVHALLTAEQRAKWAEAPHGMGMHEGMGMHGPGMFGDCPCMHGGPGAACAGCPHMGGAGATAPKPAKP
jgi:Spy/CpxP family protein refolding chaperone